MPAWAPFWKRLVADGHRVIATARRADRLTALRDDDPVMFFEHKALYPRKCEVPDGDYTIPFGEASLVREGEHVTDFPQRLGWRCEGRRGQRVRPREARRGSPPKRRALVSARRGGEAALGSASGPDVKRWHHRVRGRGCAS